MGGRSSSEDKSDKRKVRWLRRHLPSRERLERIPFVGPLLRRARDAKFLWSFDKEEVVPAFLIGWVVALSPLFGLHTVLAVLLVLLFRANLLITMVLQLISTPFTLPFLWPFLYAVGFRTVLLFSEGQVAVDLADHPLFGTSRLLIRALAFVALGGTLVGFAGTILSVAIFSICRRIWRKRTGALELDQYGRSNGT
ncbi:MAG: DUF2062 domain-containing protein [Puniceicoccales bacterium]|jgi:uncharacterized protein (DUF2062 family)|nr:DUF2062 domain-containing protein [Puniceicoccales bacterium]